MMDGKGQKTGRFRVLLKVLNPFIWLWNWFQYDAHLHGWAERASLAKEFGYDEPEYEPYDFSKDVKYF
ncbi:MAG: hypothetical protein DRP65_00475 [Planctomycetota bacterium]|nr:MAG: hypothetical protein DRP65_00475 [Planctomycetota bacterium]